MSGNSYSIGLFDGHGILGKGDTQPIYIYTTSLVSLINYIYTSFE
jgi:hypothetical protein